MGGFLLRHIAFSYLVLFIGLSGTFFFLASTFQPLSANQPLLHDYWVWVRGLPTGRSLNTGLLTNHLLASVGAAFGRTLLLLLVTSPLSCS